ncbi:PRELI domain-containing protein 1, mitochondrial-like [Hydractinia symbiolongicarpus]|uniref:PRELI domain-containing protein 1, mitochondrial-like n=1 Tax=Hydractinia symbiolongicarpus TaxID=13093 RepID=UPI00254F21A7|nr:PRELI domain-containing protein 1, mitochondrial-like [Hydractinia symbiolongicarpus]XP_057308247.1 PRELI domain-containing protein 1, mitochondrial-like [Hydractinia symbiolongicarpus]
MKFCETSSNIKYKWDHLCSMFYKRYPNPYSKHVLSEDVLSRHVENNILKTIRIYSKTNETPSWLQRILPTATAYILEESHVDIETKTIVTYTKNLTLTTFLKVEEKSIFKISNDNKDWTSVRRQSWISSSFYGLCHAFESFGAKRYISNIQRMDNGFESVLQKNNHYSTGQSTFPLPISSNM